MKKLAKRIKPGKGTQGRHFLGRYVKTTELSILEP